MAKRKHKMNKKGLELSINMLVILIIAFAVFGFGIFMVSKFFGAAESQKATIDRDTEAAIQNLLSGSTKVGVPLNRKEVKRGDSEVFGLGILNTAGSTSNFDIRVSFKQAFKSNDQEITNVNKLYLEQNWLLYDNIATIQNNDFVSIPILIAPQALSGPSQNTEKGTYIFNICVCRENQCTFPNGCTLEAGDLYGGSMKKIYVTIP